MESKMSDKPKYWSGDLGDHDDFGSTYKNIMIDGQTKFGRWANMTETNWRIYGVGKLGIGFGQKYQKQADGRWLKIEG
jgi:hypothetical protein